MSASVFVNVCYFLLSLNSVLCAGYVIFHVVFIGVDVVYRYDLLCRMYTVSCSLLYPSLILD